ncbi:DUF1254 domain-containing protein [Agrobacterium vitis]|nr:DUF1254 domain-containing protein [Agrobacterium vitis]MCM2442853.1 DUF1254 domain-containing protein [Agrobacterium vitis]
MEASGKKAPWAPINQIFNAPNLTTPATSDGGSPNCDTLYSTAWLDFSHGPLVLTVPTVTDRFYSIELASISSDNFAYVGLVATGKYGGNYLIAPSDWSGTVPDDVLDVLARCQTPIAFMLGRTGVNNSTTEDLDAAHAVQGQYRLTPLSHWQNPDAPAVTPHAQVPIGFDFNNPDGAWETMNRAMTANPPGIYPAPEQQALINLFATIGIGPNQHLGAQSNATLKGLRRAAEDGLSLLKQMSQGRGKEINQWNYPPLDLGRAGDKADYITRSALQALSGIVANDATQAVYINTWNDETGEQLSAQSQYKLTFDTHGDGFPPIVSGFNGFWSVTLYDNTYNLVPGSIAYTVNSTDPKYQSRDANGNLTILLQNEQPENLGDGVYWLQTPSDTGSGETATFFLILRVYVPAPEVSGSQLWAPPKIYKIG